MPDYNSSDNKEADKRVSEAIRNRICNEFNNLFSTIDCFRGCFLAGKGGQPPITSITEKSALSLSLRKDGGLWMHGVIIDGNNKDHQG